MGSSNFLAQRKTRRERSQLSAFELEGERHGEFEKSTGKGSENFVSIPWWPEKSTELDIILVSRGSRYCDPTVVINLRIAS